MAKKNIDFRPPLSTQDFLKSDKFVNLIVGPVGSTKTTASLMKIVLEAKRIKACADGVRRSRIAVIRNTRQMLWDSTIPDFEKWFGETGMMMKSEMRFIMRFDDCEVEVLFRGLDDANDVRRLLSLQLTFAVMDEFREINRDVFNALTGRLGRYPDKTMNGVGACDDNNKQIFKVWGATNPPDMDSFWESYISEAPDNAFVTIQPSGLSAEADWLHCLPDGYYENLVEGKSDDWVDVYVHAKFGKSLSGTPVFSSFSTERHVAQTPLNVLSSMLIIGVDAGLTPTATITQQDYQSRLLVHDSICGESMGALRFIREKLKPLLANKYAGKQSIVVIDPAAFQRAQTDERTVADIFKAEGFRVVPARTNTIVARLAAVENFLTRTVEGKQSILFNKDGCDQLILAMRSKYRYKVNTKGERDETPDKAHPWSDYCDSLQYACLHADSGSAFGAKHVSSRKEIKPHKYVYV